jgi:flavin-binding protein dodecin
VNYRNAYCVVTVSVKTQDRGKVEEIIMAGSTYIVSEGVGTSTKSWEDAARRAVEAVAETVTDLRVGEVLKQDLIVGNGKVVSYRVRLGVSFKYHAGY